MHGATSRKTLIDLTSLHTYLSFLSICILFCEWFLFFLFLGVFIFNTILLCWFRKRCTYAFLKVLEKIFTFSLCTWKKQYLYAYRHTYTYTYHKFWLYTLTIHSVKGIICLLTKKTFNVLQYQTMFIKNLSHLTSFLVWKWYTCIFHI